MSRIKIEDGLTKQERWQLNKKQKGLCIICGINKTDQPLCEECSLKSKRIKNYNKYKNLAKRKNEIVEKINLIMEASVFQPKMQDVYNHVIEELNLNCSTVTVRKYWLESLN